MNIIFFRLSVFFLTSFIHACSLTAPDKSIHLFYSENKVVIDGKATDTEWKNVTHLKNFFSPWEESVPQNTEFKAFYNAEYLFFLFNVIDTSKVCLDTIRVEHDITREDRVEIFLTADLTLKSYYCLEIDGKGRILDYFASYYRKFEDGWNLEGLEVEGKYKNNNHYTVEGAIPLKKIQELFNVNQVKNSNLFIGLFRADLSFNSDSIINEQWVSWVDIKSEIPDFHIPQAFCRLSFNNDKY